LAIRIMKFMIIMYIIWLELINILLIQNFQKLKPTIYRMEFVKFNMKYHCL
jgi:hypothetical protein